MARLTRSQIREIKKIITEHMEVVLQITVGDGSPSPALLRKLKLPKSVTDLISSSYQYGKLGAIKDKDLANTSAAEVKKLLKDVKLTAEQQHSMEQAQIRAQQYIDNLTQRVTTNVISTAISADLAMWEVVKEVVPAAIADNSPISQVAAKLRDMTGDMYRDWNRVAQTEMWNAKCQGEAEAILSGESPLSKQGADTEVYVKPAWNACSKCKQLYLERDGVTPRVFTLAELMANGNNYGRKQADWVACVPTLHPNCQCVMNVKPPDTSFDSQGNLVFTPQTK